MSESFTFKHNLRRSFGKIPELVDMPNLLEIQRNSYDLFLQKDVKPDDREDIGLQAVFNKVFPITDFSGIAELRFVKYELETFSYFGVGKLRKTETVEQATEVFQNQYERPRADLAKLDQRIKFADEIFRKLGRGGFGDGD